MPAQRSLTTAETRADASSPEVVVAPGFPRQRALARPARLALSLVVLATGACGSPATSSGSGGSTGSGGMSSGSGGASTSSGGTTSSSGGATGSGGTSSGTGGVTSSGGSGGMSGGSGGSMGSGGMSSGSGGASTSSGGASASGGANGGGGSGGAAPGGANGTGSGGAAGAGSGSCPVIAELADWPSGKGPADLGKLAANAFKSHTGDGYGGDGYAWAFAYVGALQFTKLTGDTASNMQFINDFEPYAAGTKQGPDNPAPSPDAGVDKRAFGDLPLEIFLENGDMRCKTLGLSRADKQWSATTPEGYTQDVRWWSDDMYMITSLQVWAYRATKDRKYLDRAAKTMIAYLAKLQQSDGLFWHTDQSKAYWGRANGWFASGMTEILLDLPAGSDRDAILAGYKKQMDGLVKVQITTGTDPGAWNQVLDVTTLKPEMSCTAMFTFALVTGLKNGWISDPKYVTAAKNGWIAVGKRTSSAGLLDQVCPGTGDARSVSGLAAQQKFYMDIAFQSGDRHGQPPLLWASTMLLRKDCPGVR